MSNDDNRTGCPDCDGFGYHEDPETPDDGPECTTCGGSGVVPIKPECARCGEPADELLPDGFCAACSMATVTTEPATDTPPRPLTDDEIDAAVDDMTGDEQRAALKWLAGAQPRDFAAAVWYVERQRTVGAR